MGFVANFLHFPAVQKLENWLRFDKVTESFFRHRVVIIVLQSREDSEH